MQKRRMYSAEFKREAVALASQPGVTKAQIGREMDINPNMITRWQREMTGRICWDTVREGSRPTTQQLNWVTYFRQLTKWLGKGHAKLPHCSF